jgi:hypothetical protein
LCVFFSLVCFLSFFGLLILCISTLSTFNPATRYTWLFVFVAIAVERIFVWWISSLE